MNGSRVLSLALGPTHNVNLSKIFCWLFHATKWSYIYHFLSWPYGGAARTVCISRQASDWIFIQLSWRWIILWSASINNPEWAQEGGAFSPHPDHSPSWGNHFENLTQLSKADATSLASSFAYLASPCKFCIPWRWDASRIFPWTNTPCWV